MMTKMVRVMMVAVLAATLTASAGCMGSESGEDGSGTGGGTGGGTGTGGRTGGGTGGTGGTTVKPALPAVSGSFQVVTTIDLTVNAVLPSTAADGVGTLQALKTDPDLKGIRVVLLTARGQIRDQEAGRTAGADEYLVKPFSPLQLIDTIELLLGGS